MRASPEWEEARKKEQEARKKEQEARKKEQEELDRIRNASNNQTREASNDRERVTQIQGRLWASGTLMGDVKFTFSPKKAPMEMISLKMSWKRSISVVPSCHKFHQKYGNFAISKNFIWTRTN